MPDDAQEEVVEEGGESPPPKSKSKMSVKTLVLIGLPLIMVQAALAFFVVKKVVQPVLPETKQVQAEGKKSSDGGKKSSAEGKVDLSTYAPLKVEDIIVNPAETQGQRYLSVSVVYYVPEELKEAMGEFEDEVRSAIIEVISEKRLDELDEPADRQILRGLIVARLNNTIKRNFSEKFKTKEEFSIPRLVFSKYTLQ
ncbi:MAG: flagellar basal body-associated FliL family protein [Gemmatimonadota bacterium]|nr:flagellar basal body-associated FliL family protein [Gemmatimonadota bacterium]